MATLRAARLDQSRWAPDWLRWRSSASPDSPAVRRGSLEWSYRELQERVSSISAALLSRGVGRGSRVALLMPPSEAYIAAVHAVARLGAVAVPINHRLSPSELHRLLTDSRPSLAIHDETFAADARKPGVPGSVRWALAKELMEERPKDGEHVVGDRLDTRGLHAIVYTSGSSGGAKGVQLTLANLMWNAISVGFRTSLSSVDRWLLCMPLFHVGGYAVIFRSVLYGSSVVVHPKFDAKAVSLSLDNDDVTLASFVPTMLTDVLEARGGKPLSSKVRLLFIGGGMPDHTLVAAIRLRRLPALLTYGMTETCSQVAVSRPWISRDGPSYEAVFPNEIVVTKPGSKKAVTQLPPGEVGEVAVRGPAVFAGYWRKPGVTRSRFRGDWFLTGDLGYLQVATTSRGRKAQGVVILGRKEETIVTGGEKVFPSEVEEALKEHPAVKDVVVMGLDDARWGQRVVAVLEAKADGASPSGPELARFLGERLAHYKLPKVYRFVPALPRTAAGKTKRAEVRALLERGDEGN
ncbi:MAG TPA: AMP-binding protein [Nitrososphaerales archaeon]|nr:AMP-binding protein [Nitrososphaerales archaeon]